MRGPTKGACVQKKRLELGVKGTQVSLRKGVTYYYPKGRGMERGVRAVSTRGAKVGDVHRKITFIRRLQKIRQLREV